MSSRRQNFQTVSWFNDIFKRKRLNLNPSYQRRSVWNQTFKDYFIDTLLLDYPAPAIFLYEEIDDQGTSRYNVVDGKQRLTAIFEFVGNEFPVAETAERSDLRGKYFKDLDSEDKKVFWAYEFSVEYLISSDEKVINGIFDRINRNVAKLTPQELRHAKFDGRFLTACERLAEHLDAALPSKFPRLAPKSRKQMKDVELVATLLLLLEVGTRGHSQAELDEAFARRDNDWEDEETIEERFRAVVGTLKNLVKADSEVAKSRLRNQADFYSLFGAIDQLIQSDKELPEPRECAKRLLAFVERVDDEGLRSADALAEGYYQAARSASNDRTPRATRIEALLKTLSGPLP